MRRALTGPLGLWLAVIAVHALLAWLALTLPGWTLGDVDQVYYQWVDRILGGGQIVGIDTVWVYPPLALAPILLPAIAGMGNYTAAWLVLIAILDAAAIAVLTDWGRSADRRPIAWWWLGFLVLLGPIAIARIDAVTAALGVAAAAVLLTRPSVAAAILTAAAWIKVWPAGILAAALVALRSRAVVAVAALGTSVAVLVAGLLLGGSGSLFSFITEQTGRGLQVESVAATGWMWALALGADGVEVYYDTGILTYQVRAPGAEIAAAVTTPLLAALVGIVLALAALAVRRGVEPTAVLAPAALGVTAALIVGNKVGSPQFTAWLAVPVVLALVALGRAGWRAWRAPPRHGEPVRRAHPGALPRPVRLAARRRSGPRRGADRPQRPHRRPARLGRRRPRPTPPFRPRHRPRETQEHTMIVAFSVAPSGARPDAPERTDSVHDAVAAAVRVVRESGLPNRTSSMFTEIEGEWDEVMDVVKRATEAVGAYGTRVSLVLKADIRPGYTGEIEGKLQRLESAIESSPA